MKKSSRWIWGLIIIIVVGVLIYAFHKPITVSNTGDMTASSTDNASNLNQAKNQYSGAKGAAPRVTAAGFASVSSTTAVVVGTVIPNGAATTYWFEYGTTMNYGSSVDAMTAPASYKELGAAGYITGLKPNTEYYFRIGARNAYGTVYSGQYKFITKGQ